MSNFRVPERARREIAERSQLRLDDPEQAEIERLAEIARGIGVGRTLRDGAIEQVEEHAPDDWKRVALAAVRAVALRLDELTTDDVWTELDELAPAEPRAMGAIMPAAARLGWIERTDRVRQGYRGLNHARPQTLWRSLLR